jgi:hypothetical protein
MSILLIDIGDPDSKSNLVSYQKSLQEKYAKQKYKKINKVFAINLNAIALEWLFNKVLGDDDQNLQQLIKRKKIHKIILAAHGSSKDTASFSLMRPSLNGFVRIKPENLAIFVNLILESLDSNRQLITSTPLSLSLIVCFAARAEAFDKALLDYNEADLKSSLAFKFYQKLCEPEKFRISMTARTGEAMINRVTGRSEVVTRLGEAKLEAVKKLEESQDDFETLEAYEEYFDANYEDHWDDYTAKYGRIRYEMKGDDIEVKFKHEKDKIEPDIKIAEQADFIPEQKMAPKVKINIAAAPASPHKQRMNSEAKINNASLAGARELSLFNKKSQKRKDAHPQYHNQKRFSEKQAQSRCQKQSFR